tara:strand:+ start:1351 stop:2190 length:840 start_codon:yes stop_codon:yes gene_type:complete
MITSIIFSKDRPLQLDLCLKSLNKNFPDSENIVIYKNSEAFEEAHQKLMSEHSDTEFWPQSHSLFKDVYLAIVNTDREYICFFTDDDIVYNPLPTIRKDMLDNEDVICFSLRMGLNINQRSHEGSTFEDIPAQLYEIDKYTVYWNKTRNTYGSYWSYSLSVDGHIFRKNDLIEMFDEMCYLNERYDWEQTPNRIESVMQRFWTDTPPIMASFPESVMVNSPNNRVQDSHLSNKWGEVYNYDQEALLEKYMEGKRINLDLLDFSDIKCPHTEIDIMKGLV